MDTVQQEVNNLYKERFGQMVASVLFMSKDIDPETAEDIVQDSFTAALVSWRANGIPDNKSGWIYTVCRNKALNLFKKEKRIRPLTENIGTLTENLNTVEVENGFSESILDDHQLKLLFACAHPDLAPKTQVVITLKYVINLKVEAIAKSLGMSIDGVDKLLVRARQKIRDEKIILEEPAADELKSRLPSVHKVIYLIFNEGYKSSAGNELLREELCEEALLLNKSLLDSSLVNSDTKALQALMLFNSARFKSRFGSEGELVALEDQDRSLWNEELISLGNYFFNKSQSGPVSSYHLEASIAYLHCAAKNFQSTDWQTIAGLYKRLLYKYKNPFVELNHAIALYYAGQKQDSFNILHSLEAHPFLGRYFLLNAALGKFHQMEGRDDLARKYLQTALRQTAFEEEKTFIRKMINE
jgi:RNA polymerase sigma-70 factor (ECF subfamily)